MVITHIMIHIGVTVHGIPIIMDIIGRIIIIITGVEIGMGIIMEITTTDIITNTMTAINAIGIVAEAIEEIEILIVQITTLMDIQMEFLIL